MMIQNGNHKRTRKLNRLKPVRHKAAFNANGVYKLLIWTNVHFIGVNPIQAKSCIRYWIDHVDKQIKCCGVFNTIQRLKTVRLHVTRYLCGDPLFTNNNNVAIDKSGLPRCLGPLKGFLVNKECKQSIRFVMTLLMISRTIRGGHKAPNTESITTPSRFIMTEQLLKEIPMALKRLNISKADISKTSFSEFHQSTKSGPNGQALITSVNDAFAIANDQRLLDNIDVISGNKDLSDSIYWITRNIDLQKGQESMHTRSTTLDRKLSIVLDPEAKTRVIAIVDYGSQAALRPLHNYVMQILKNIPDDRTFNQTAMLQNHDDSNHYGSLDLSNATDRFPLQFQKKVISEIFNDSFSDAGADIMVERPFYHQGKSDLFYRAGQPMGAYSSGAVFALSHHVAVQISAMRVSEDATGKYMILGDDIVINNDKIAQSYISLMNEFGVELSTTKTHKSGNMYEFAKRWYQDGIEVSGIPLNGFLEINQHYGRAIPEIWNAFDRIGRHNAIAAPEIFRELFEILGIYFRFSSKAYILSLGLSYVKYECQVGFSKILPKLNISCNGGFDKSKDYIVQRQNDIIAGKVEQALKQGAKDRDVFNERLLQSFKGTPSSSATISRQSLSRFQKYIPCISVIERVLNTQRNLLSKVVDKDISTIELLQEYSRGINRSPILLMQTRKKDLIIHTQIDLMQEIIKISNSLEDINKLALQDLIDESEAFKMQSNLLPAYSKRTVMFGYPK